ncbi:class I SAM-dependent methyltransferase [Patescibacteria group bacterium]|nr:class I SAM-dependent methyltransferase [Patescibacteria group bacterium]
MIKDLIKETLRGKSLPRILINNRMKKTQELQGRILALASGNKRPSVYRFLKINKNAKIVSVDISKERNPDFIADLEKPFPFKNNEFDCITCFNLLEHIFDHKNVINESYRSLKEGGRFIGTIPFLGSVHADPDDYFRYTKSTLEKLFKEFKQVNIEALGYGPFSVNYYMIASAFPKILRIPLLFFAILSDKIVVKFKKNHGKDKYVLMYYFECKK